MRITIPKPCHENWDAMQPEEGGRHCEACAFKVQDLSSASDAELIERIAEGQMPKCARFRTSQLNRLLVATAAVGLTESAAASKTHPNTSQVNPPDFLAVSIEDWTFKQEMLRFLNEHYWASQLYVKRPATFLPIPRN
ncbi:MAG: hypothetical protein WAT74_02630 [Flavobacteriales bacterium]